MNRPKTHVLLVEDDEAHAELVRRAFEPRAATVRLQVAENLHQARQQIEESPPDLMLIDLLLPDGRGTDLLPRGGDEADFPIVIMTSYGNEGVAVEAMKAGALHYVVKSPTTLADMPQIVEGALREWGHIFERRRAEEALRASEEHFRSLIENAQDIILVVDEEGIIHYASPSVERALGIPAEKQVEANLFDLVHPEDKDDLAQKLQQVFAEPSIPRFLEYRQDHRDGSLRYLEAVASSQRQSEGLRRAVINSRDVTDRKLAEEERQRLAEQLRHSQKWEIIGTLAGGIANEFNNMLTPILGFATLARDEAEIGSRIYKRLERVLAAANRSKKLADQLLVFSRQEEPRRQKIRLHKVVEEALKLLRPTIPPTIEIQRRLHLENDTVFADPDQMNQMLMNLCTNAYHAMPDGGSLKVELAAVEDPQELQGLHPAVTGEDHLCLIVRDTGHGMDSDTSNRALEPFFTTKIGEKRSGLGLSVTHGIVASHGGGLRVESAPNEGTAVYVFLPLAPEDS
jgi:PAS domain S-box-containing protein